MLLDNDVWPEYARRDVAAIAADRDQEPLDAVHDLLLGAAEDPAALMVLIHAYTEEEQREAFGHPLCVPGSDATTLAPDGPLAGRFFHGAYTWAAWYLRFCLEQQVLSLPEALHRLTGAPAARVGLPDRGLVRPGRMPISWYSTPAIQRGRDDIRPQPACDGHGHRRRQRHCDAERRQADRLPRRPRPSTCVNPEISVLDGCYLPAP